MPIYEYRCKDCGNINEFLVGVGRDNVEIKCVHCGSKSLDKIVSKSYVSNSINAFNSHGGKTCRGRDERCNTPPCSVDNTCKR